MSARQNKSVVGAYDAKSRFSELLELAESGREITITRHGHPVAKLVPIKQRTTPEQRRAAIRSWMTTSRGLSLGKLKVRDLINEGRP
jgi:prevent-host-death family protein